MIPPPPERGDRRRPCFRRRRRRGRVAASAIPAALAALVVVAITSSASTSVRVQAQAAPAVPTSSLPSTVDNGLEATTATPPPRRPPASPALNPDGTSQSCTLLTLLPFTMRGGEPTQRSPEDTYSHLAAAVMAMDDFNTRNDGVVEALGWDEFALGLGGGGGGGGDGVNGTNQGGLGLGVGVGCDVTFASDSAILDDEDSQSASLSHILSMTSSTQHRPICALVGVENDRAAVSAGVAAAALNVPYITHASMSDELGRSRFYPLTSRTGPRYSTIAKAMVSFVAEGLGRDYIYVLHTGFGDDLAEDIVRRAGLVGLTSRVANPAPPFWVKEGPMSVYNTLKAVKESGYRTVVLACARADHLYFIAEAAAEHGMLDGDDYLFVISPLINMNMMDDPKPLLRRGGALARLLTGAASVQPIETFDYNFATSESSDGGDGDARRRQRRAEEEPVQQLAPATTAAPPQREVSPFLQAWNSKNATFLARVNALYPLYGALNGTDRAQARYDAPPDYFQKHAPRRYSGFLYDAIIATGLGACRALATQEAEAAEAEAAAQEQAKKAKEAQNSEGEGGAANDAAKEQVEPPVRPLPPAKGTQPPPKGIPPLPRPVRNNHFDGIMTSNFVGASGHVSFKRDHDGEEREQDTMAFGVFNVRPLADDEGRRGVSDGIGYGDGNGDGDGADGNGGDDIFNFARPADGDGYDAGGGTGGNRDRRRHRFLAGPDDFGNVDYDGLPVEEGDRARFTHTLTSVYLPLATSSFSAIESKNGGKNSTAALRQHRRRWQTIGMVPFVYASGTSTQPSPLRNDPEGNFLSSGVRVAGLTLMALCLAASFGSLAWLFVRRQKHVVRASQPEFLYITCLGCAVTCSTILTLSFDESYGLGPERLGALCRATPWLVGLGYIIVYSSLFCKLWRINRVMQMKRRREVKISRAFVPFVILILAAMIVLAVWTGVDPLVWHRELLDADTDETIGYCASESGNSALPYVASLIAVMITAMILTAWKAYRTSDISEDFVETKWIFVAIFTQIQLLAIGIPVLALVGNTSTDTTYIVKVMLLWLFSIVMIGLIVGPKMWRVEGEKLVCCSQGGSAAGTGSSSTQQRAATGGRGAIGARRGAAHISGLANPLSSSVRRELEDVSLSGSSRKSSGFSSFRQSSLFRSSVPGKERHTSVTSNLRTSATSLRASAAGGGGDASHLADNDNMTTQPIVEESAQDSPTDTVEKKKTGL